MKKLFLGLESLITLFIAGMYQCSSDSRGSDFPGGGVHWCATNWVDWTGLLVLI